MTDTTSTKMTFRHECYKLAHDLDEDDTLPSINHPPRRRLLPKIPEGMKPLEKTWKREIDKCDPLSIEIANNSGGGSLRWTRNLSTNMTLSIDTDPSTGQTISVRMVNKHSDGHHSIELVHTGQDSSHGNSVRSAHNDSGVSSNLQSPTLSLCDSSLEHSTASGTPSNTDPMPQTHRVLHQFCARHADQLDLQIGDGVHVLKEYDDHWCEGVNLRTQARGIFPSAMVTDVDYNEFSLEPSSLLTEARLPEMINFRIKRERFQLDFLGSVEVCCAKGDQVVEEAMERIAQANQATSLAGIKVPYPCILEVSDIGVRMMSHTKVASLIDKLNNRQADKHKDSEKGPPPPHDYFFSLLQLTYCGMQVKADGNYFAFITRHPSGQCRHACHVFLTPTNRDEVCETIGQSFQRFYAQFVDVIVAPSICSH